MDCALIDDGVVLAVARDPAPATSLGPVEGAAFVEFDPAVQVCAGMLWDGETLSVPPPPED